MTRLFLKKGPMLTRRWLALLAAVFTLSLLELSLWWDYDATYQFPGLKAVSFALPFFIGVFLLGYYQSVFRTDRSNRVFRLPSFWHWLPGIFFLLKNSTFYFAHTGVHLPPFHHHPAFIHHGSDFTIWLLLLHLAVYGAWIYLKYFPSLSLDRQLLRWHHWMLGACLGLAVVFGSFHKIYELGWMTSSLHLFFGLVLMAIMALTLRLGDVQPGVAEGEPLATAMAEMKYRHSALNTESARSLAHRIADLFEMKALFKDSDLSLDSLSGRLMRRRPRIFYGMCSKDARRAVSQDVERGIRGVRNGFEKTAAPTDGQ